MIGRSTKAIPLAVLVILGFLLNGTLKAQAKFRSDGTISLEPSSDPEGDVANNTTPSWEEAVELFSALANDEPRAHWLQVGLSDIGRPIHVLVLSRVPTRMRGLAALADLRRKLPEHGRILINNAIHPGEPCGVDASLAWAREILNGDDAVLDSVMVAIVPMYNVGGALNRNCCTRANQDGPEEYGFRGNGRNLDLNRDFIKRDSRNAESFTSLYHAWLPDVFLDTHTSNGADYPYTMTLITTQPDKAGPVLGPYLRERVNPALYAGMEERDWPMVPYVQPRDQVPESGIVGFLETPRYSTGYTALWGTLGFTSEAHMLKPFVDRVAATRDLIEVLVQWTASHKGEVQAIRAASAAHFSSASEIPVRWALSALDSTMLAFTGYTARREVSAVTNGVRLIYDREELWKADIPVFNRYLTTDVAQVPHAYIVPQAWREVISRLDANGVHMLRVPRDTSLVVEVTYIDAFHSGSLAYEGHHMNRLDSMHRLTQSVQLFLGDYIIPTAAQPSIRYIVETLEPQAHDAFFVWNFFDSAMQRKEGYSAYVFEETAEELLAADHALRKAFNSARKEHPDWSENEGAALRWVYEHSPHFEGTSNRYPVYRLVEPIDWTAPLSSGETNQ